MGDESLIKEGKLHFQHESLMLGYSLRDVEDFQFIEEKYGILLDLTYTPVRTTSGINQWICADCGSMMKKSYKDIVMTGLKCTGCELGSDIGIIERQWVARKFKCLECDERHTYAILAGHHYAKVHRKDPNIVAHEYRRRTRRMVLDSGWKPKNPLQSCLYPCHICKVENTPPTMVKAHWEWHHTDVDLIKYKTDFFLSIGIPKVECNWCGEITEPIASHIKFAKTHPACVRQHMQKEVQMAIGIRNQKGEPTNLEGEVIPESELIFPGD